ncbi:MAG: sugar ABC transporter ATP-binding protein [Candidatus Choladocola sp.]|nr:sugar ABC transporter ATP-binding protein [Candidatus Choladocola sp.]
MSEVIVKMDGISKSFGGIKALDNVKIELRKGEVHALMGENGAGKSTLMKIMTGVYTKDEGRMFLYDENKKEMTEVEMKSPLMAQKNGLSMVFQELNLLENMNIAENIFIGREPSKSGGFLDRSELNRKAVHELEKVSLNVDPETMVSELSCGQKQCVEIAKALSFQARVVVFDEPTASLSEKESQVLFKIINDLKNQGVCIVYISHRMEEVFELSDRITVFRNGTYIDTVNSSDVTEADLIKMMIGHEIEDENTHNCKDMKTAKPILEVKNVKVFPNSKPVEFKLYEREILGFFGLVGAGRTELARIIFGVDPIGEGEIYIEGNKVRISCPQDAIRNGIGLVPEDRKNLGLILGMSIRDNMLISKLQQLKSAFLKKSELKQITGTYIEDLGIVLRNDEQEVRELSGGNQQKVVIAKWLAMTPNILIMDEPTRGIDVGAKNEIYALMRKLTNQGKSIIMISSEMAEVMKVSDRIVVMHEGEISGEVSGEEITKNRIMQAAFGGKR